MPGGLRIPVAFTAVAVIAALMILASLAVRASRPPFRQRACGPSSSEHRRVVDLSATLVGLARDNQNAAFRAQLSTEATESAAAGLLDYYRGLAASGYAVERVTGYGTRHLKVVYQTESQYAAPSRTAVLWLREAGQFRPVSLWR